MKNLSPLGERMAERFHDLGKDQNDIARACKISQSAVSQIMSRGTTKHLHLIAKELLTTTEWLLTGQPPKEKDIKFSSGVTKTQGGLSDSSWPPSVGVDAIEVARRGATALSVIADYKSLGPEEKDEARALLGVLFGQEDNKKRDVSPARAHGRPLPGAQGDAAGKGKGKR